MIEVVGIEKLNRIILSIIAARVQSRRLRTTRNGRKRKNLENSFRWNCKTQLTAHLRVTSVLFTQTFFVFRLGITCSVDRPMIKFWSIRIEILLKFLRKLLSFFSLLVESFHYNEGGPSFL